MTWSTSLRYLIDLLFRRNGFRGEVSPANQNSPNKANEKPRLQIDLIDSNIAWKGVVLHCSATKDTQLDNWQSIVRYHTSYRVDYNIVTKEEFEQAKILRAGKSKPVLQRPWADVGYHGGIEMVDGVLKYQHGRSLNMTGAHAAVAGVSSEYNRTHIGICFVGDFETIPPSKELRDFCLSAIRTIMDKYGIAKENIIGHREVYDALGVPRQKTCPGSLWDMNSFREDL